MYEKSHLNRFSLIHSADQKLTANLFYFVCMLDHKYTQLPSGEKLIKIG